MDGERPLGNAQTSRDAVKAFRQTGALNDSALDREIAAAVNVDPSPEFLARVRMRVASEPVPAPWRLRWPALIAGAAVLAMVIVALVMNRQESETTIAPQHAAANPSVALPPESTVTRSPIEPVASPDRPRVVRADGSRPVVRRINARTDEPRLPEVVVSEDEQRAFELLLTTISQGRLPPLPEAETAAASITPAVLEIAPVIIEPLPDVARLE